METQHACIVLSEYVNRAKKKSSLRCERIIRKSKSSIRLLVIGVPGSAAPGSFPSFLNPLPMVRKAEQLVLKFVGAVFPGRVFLVQSNHVSDAFFFFSPFSQFFL